MNERDKRIIEMYESGIPYYKIAKILGITKHAAGKVLKLSGVAMKNFSDYRKFAINEGYFENIDSWQKAYILGFLMADGYNNQKEGKIRINIHKSDIEVLNFINSQIQPDKPDAIRYTYGGKQLDKTDKRIAYLCLYSRKLSDDLAKLGCVQNKSLTLQFPKAVPSNLLADFVRGFFDGDGGITKSTYGSGYCAYFFSSLSFLLDTKQVLIENGIKNISIYVKGVIFELKICSKKSVIALRDWMYNGKFALERKRNRFASV